MKKKSILIWILSLVVLAVLAFVLVGEIQKYFYPREYSESVARYSFEFDVPEPLIYAVIRTESNFNPNAESSAGACGLMQIMPDTFDWLADRLDETPNDGQVFDPDTNIRYGVSYLRFLYDRFGSWETAVAAYNAGHGRVGDWLLDARFSIDGKSLSDIPLLETKNYVNQVAESRDIYENLYY